MAQTYNRKKLIERADRLWSQAVLSRDFHRCQLCFRYGTDPHHIISRRHKATAFDLDNGICLCRECHDRMKTTEGKEWLRIVLNKTKSGLYERLQEQAQVIVHYKNHDLLEIIEGLKRG